MEGSSTPSLALRVWQTCRERGFRYALHKTLRRAPGSRPALKRRLVYRDPRDYWTLRGGHDYFLEQEGQPARSVRSEWMADQIARYEPTSILEIGCGYGKQLRALRNRLDIPLVGLDFSRSQLQQGSRYLADLEDLQLVLGRGDQLPFADDSFDLVLTSAVILHNPPRLAERIRQEVLRVARRWAAHNEDTDFSYNRYGYDTAAWYVERGIPLAQSGPIPVLDEAEARITQFCVAELPPS